MKLQDWSADRWSFLIGRPTVGVSSLVGRLLEFLHWSADCWSFLIGRPTVGVSSLVGRPLEFPHWSADCWSFLIGRPTVGVSSLVGRLLEFPHWSLLFQNEKAGNSSVFTFSGERVSGSMYHYIVLL